MRMTCLALVLLPFISYGGTEVLRISSDRPSYAAGEKAVLRAMLTSKPDNSTMEFDLEGRLNGVLLPISRITEFEFFSVTEGLAAGTHSWSATVYLQDARLARDLKASLNFFATEIQKIDALLETETDPEKIAALQAARTRYVGLRAATEAQLASIRTQVYGPVSTSLFVN